MTTLIESARYEPRTQSGPALRAFKTIMDKWGLAEDQRLVLLGNPGRSTYYGWVKATSLVLGNDTLERISYILGIFKALRILLPEDAADQWVWRPNRDPLFGGKRAIDIMLHGQVGDLLRVRDYLDTQRG